MKKQEIAAIIDVLAMLDVEHDARVAAEAQRDLLRELYQIELNKTLKEKES